MALKPTPRRRGAVAFLGLAVAVTGLSTPAWAVPDATQVVISEVYGGGGNSGAQFTHDFIELYNPTDRDVVLDGHVLEYFSASGGSGGTLTLSGTIKAKGFFLVRAAQGTGGTAGLPTTDATSTFAMSGSNGSVELRSGAAVVDLVGYGTAIRNETKAAPGLTNTMSAQRDAAGKNTDDNSVDFVAAAPTPTNSAGETQAPSGPDPDPGTTEPLAATIAEIQGTGTASPLAGQKVVTSGVVTAAYATGGFDGFYIQTPGEDRTPDASDGLFVYSKGFDGAQIVPGASVRVTGTAGEFNGLTQVTAAPADVTVLAESLGTVQPKTSVPGTDCALPGTDCADAAAIDAAREKVEGEALALTGDFTVTDVYDGSAYNGGSASSANFGEVGLAAASKVPLLTPTDVVDPHDAAAVKARTAYNDAHRVILDDGSTMNYSTAANTGNPVPWHTADHHVRVGAAVTFPESVILDQRFGWKLQPTSRVVGAPSASQPQFEQTRRAPEAVKGELKLATFNVLNYFTTLGTTLADVCTSYKDREGDPVTVNRCDTLPNGPRGAWDEEDFARQQAKIVKAINAIDADVVSLEEIENNLAVGTGDRDKAIAALVAELNRGAGTERWAYVASPAAVPASEDVIRTGFIYDPSAVETVGEAKILIDDPAFHNARDPFAQAFKPKGGTDAETFAVVVNHFKSKGSGADDGTGQGNANPDRVAQAKALATFSDAFAADRGTDKVFLTGDFNAYSKEDPVTELEKAGFERLESSFGGAEKSYSFDGMSGSLDHVFASPAAKAWVDEVDVWESNANESVHRQYSRHNYNVTQLVDDTGFSASDHNPAIVGFTPAGTVAPTGPVDVQIVASNDFHGRLGVAANLAGAVGQLRAEEPNTVFVGVGDQIGASTFESFIAKDKPTIDVLNAMGLEVSAAGNHEFDAGLEDLVGRVMAPEDATSNPDGGAEWQYLAANLRKKSDGSYALGDVAASPGTSDGATWMKEIDGVKVGFVGAVTEDLPALVSPSGIRDADVTAIVEEVNAAADRLTADGADAVVLLGHEGAQDVTPEAAQDVAKAFGKIVAGVDDDVDAIFSAHTHLRYAHEIDGRPVISAGEYGTHLAKVVLSVDPATDEVSVKTNEVVEVAQVPAVAPDAVALKDEVAGIVAEATSQADVLGARELGQIDSPLRRAVLATGAENRGGESTLGNLVAEVHRWATRKDAQGGAEIAFMNPGGLRADMVGNAEGGYPAAVTYKQAAAVQPFANTLVNMKLTGAQLKEVLEQQWQLDASGNVPTRPFLRLGASDGFTYTFDETRAQGDRITGIWLDGRAIQTSRNYSVTVNSFLASGGDNFRAFASGAERVDTGQSDLTAMVDYMAANTPVAVDTAQRAVGLVAPAEAFHLPGSEVTLKVSSWSYSAPDSVVDEEIAVLVDGKEVGTAAVDNTVAAEPFDRTGRSDVKFTLPADLAAGKHTVTLKGRTTGTEVDTRLAVKAASALEVVAGAGVVKVGENAEIKVKVAGTDSGLVSASVDGRVVGGTELVDGAGTLVLAPFTSAGARTVELKFHGTATAAPATATTTVTVEAAPVEEKATPTLTVTASPRTVTVNTGRTTLDVRVAGGKGTPTGTLIVLDGYRLVGAGDLAGGRARITVENLKSVGRRPLTVRYLGDDARRPAVATVAVDVVKASPKVTISTGKRATVGSKATVKVKVKSTGQKVSGKVRIAVTLKGRTTTRTVTVKGGVASAKFSLKRAGKAKVKATYLGNSTISKKSAKSSRITVVAKRR